MRILLAEDERELSNALTAILKHNHYSVDAVYDGQEALDYGISSNYDVIILDIMMPCLDGLTVLQKLREQNVTVPVLMLTAKSELEDRVLGLDTGADDYLSKPFAMKELLARVRAMTRRKSDYAPNLLEMGGISLNRSSFELSNGPTSFRLGNKEFQVLEMLMCASGRLISAEQFIERIWGYDADAEVNVVWIHISFLRKKLAALNADVEIKMIRSAGYRLELQK